jgi:hypothetical protein
MLPGGGMHEEENGGSIIQSTEKGAETFADFG